jgi:hypothetical protein
MNTVKPLTPVLLAVFMLSLGCMKKPEVEGYRVLSYDAATHDRRASLHGCESSLLDSTGAPCDKRFNPPKEVTHVLLPGL